MVSRVIVSLVAATQVDAQSIAAKLNAASTKQTTVFLEEPVAPKTTLKGQWVVRSDCAFATRADADAYFNDLQANWMTQSLVLAGSLVTVHDCCVGDAVTVSCRGSSYKESLK